MTKEKRDKLPKAKALETVHPNRGSETTLISTVADRYARNRSVRALVNALGSIPFVSGPIAIAHDNLLQRYQDDQCARLVQLFDRLAAGEVGLTQEVIESEPFLHCFLTTTEAIRRANRDEKIDIFSEILIDFVRKNKTDNKEEFDFVINVIEELTINELKLLLVVEKYEDKYYKDGRFNSRVGHEGLLLSMVSSKLGITVDDLELEGWAVRLNRTGCYSMLGWRKGPAKDCRLTGLYYKVKEYILHLGPDTAVHTPASR